ncbi:MAG: hypothetical protein PF484_01770 [Bacteroidales bacterium]|jgi:hypothetical protein|nr:hypothetical protein [Bacteroidales bacterium]
MNKDEKHTKGYYIGLGLAIGIPLGIPVGLMLGNIALGPAIGAPIGLIIGAILENKFNKEPLILSKEDTVKQKNFTWLLLLLGVVIFAIFLLSFILFKS